MMTKPMKRTSAGPTKKAISGRLRRAAGARTAVRGAGPAETAGPGEVREVID